MLGHVITVKGMEDCVDGYCLEMKAMREGDQPW